jgi:hypothetical protein
MPVGTKRRLMLPWSEVCLHMGLHDQVREVELLPDGMARISLDHGYTLVTAGEAGIYHDRKIGYYTY